MQAPPRGHDPDIVQTRVGHTPSRGKQQIWFLSEAPGRLQQQLLPGAAQVGDIVVAIRLTGNAYQRIEVYAVEKPARRVRGRVEASLGYLKDLAWEELPGSLRTVLRKGRTLERPLEEDEAESFAEFLRSRTGVDLGRIEEGIETVPNSEDETSESVEADERPTGAIASAGEDTIDGLVAQHAAEDVESDVATAAAPAAPAASAGDSPPSPPPLPQVIQQVLLLPSAPAALPAAYAATLQPPDDLVQLDIRDSEVALSYQGPSRLWERYTSSVDAAALAVAGGTPVERGQRLFRAVINGQARDNDHRSTLDGLKVARRDLEGRTRIELLCDRAVSHVPWELLTDPDVDPGTPLAIRPRSPLYRFVQSNAARGVQVVEAAPAKLGVAICSPPNLDAHFAGLAKIDEEREWALLEDAVGHLHKALERSRVIRDAAALRQVMAVSHVVHVVAHGVKHGGVYGLAIPRGAGEVPFVSQEELVSWASGSATLQLVVLCCCDSAVGSTGAAAIRALGPALVDRGVPACIAMQGKLGFEAARLFAAHFYDALVRSGRVDSAVATTRAELFHAASRVGADQWYRPVLYMNGRSGKLLDVSKSSHELDRVAAPPSSLPLAFREAQDRSSLTALAASGASTASLIEQAYARGRERRRETERHLLQDRVRIGGLATEFGALDWSALRDRVVERTREVKDGEVTSPGLVLDDAVYRQTAAALRSGKHIVFIGPPGTGKTTLADCIADIGRDANLCTGVAHATATADWTTFDTVGGYLPDSDGALSLRLGVVLDAVREGRWLVLDEINRAEVDKAFGELFTLLSGQDVDLPYRNGEQPVRLLAARRKGQWDEGARPTDYVCHPSWRILASMNVYDRSLLYAMSLAFMRRFAFVDLDVPSITADGGPYAELVAAWLPGDPVGADCISRMLRAEPLTRYRAVGPAIVRDMIRFVQQLHPLDEVYADPDARVRTETAYCEAFLLFVTPQLEGLADDALRGIAETALATIFPRALESARNALQRRIQQSGAHL